MSVKYLEFGTQKPQVEGLLDPGSLRPARYRLFIYLFLTQTREMDQWLSVYCLSDALAKDPKLSSQHPPWSAPQLPIIPAPEDPIPSFGLRSH